MVRIQQVKQALSIFLIFALMASTFSKLSVFTNYLLNKEIITQKYCVNKNKPKLKCEGKCHLSKEISKQDKQENSGKILKEISEFPLIFDGNQTALSMPSITAFNKIWRNSVFLLSDYFHSILRPPAC